jgi:hypothetical protein
MNRFTLAALCFVVASLAGAQQAPPSNVKATPTDGTAPPPATETTATTTAEPEPDSVPAPAKPVDSPLVSAAKANAGHKKSTRKVITNADVKKANGKLMIISQKPAPATPADTKGPIQKQDDELRARDAADTKVAAAEKKVAGLEADLHRVEQAFYEENNPTYRDDVIQKRFDQAKRQLDDARKELADARDERAKLENP